MRQRARLAAALAAVLLAACAARVPEAVSPLGRDHPLAGQILASASGELIAPDMLIARLAPARFVLLGEKHDNPDHHGLQAWIAERLAARRALGLAFEMIGEDQAPALAAWLATRPREPGGLGPAIGWERSGWPPWEQYAPIAGAVLGRTGRIVAGNPSRERTRVVGSRGLAALDQTELARLGLDAPLDPVARQGMTAAIRDGHCGMLPEAQVPYMIEVQRLRDASMAAALIAAAEGLDGAILIAGAEHARRDRGVPGHLARLAPRDPVATLAFLEVDPARTRPEQYGAAGAFDYLWFTPRVSDEDPCVRFADQLRRTRPPASRP